MKRTIALTGLIVGVCALACAQDYSGNRVVIPGRDRNHRIVDASVIGGSINVRTAGGSDVIVETGSGRNRPSPPDRAPAGMHRIDGGWNGPLQVEENGDTIHISTTPRGTGENLAITVPVNTSLKLHTVHGDLTVDGVHGEVDAETTHGEITLTNIAGTVVANTLHGAMKVSMTQVDQTKPLSFNTMNGDVDVTLPADVKLNLKLRALRGEIWSDFEVRLTGSSPSPRSGRSGPYRLGIGPTMNGTINGGGTDATFYTVNGKITIRKR